MGTPQEPTSTADHQPDPADEDDEVSRLQRDLAVANDCGPVDGAEPDQ